MAQVGREHGRAHLQRSAAAGHGQQRQHVGPVRDAGHPRAVEARAPPRRPTPRPPWAPSPAGSASPRRSSSCFPRTAAPADPKISGCLRFLPGEAEAPSGRQTAAGLGTWQRWPLPGSGHRAHRVRRPDGHRPRAGPGSSGSTCSGFYVTAEEPGVVYLRGYEEFVHHSVALRVGPQPACSRWASACGRPTTSTAPSGGSPSAAARPSGCRPGATTGLGPAVRARDPLGFTVELVHEMEPVERLVQRYDLRRGVGINRIDHVNIAIPGRARRLRALPGARVRAVRDDRGPVRRHPLRGVDVPQADGPRRRLHARCRARCSTTSRSPCPSRTTS